MLLPATKTVRALATLQRLQTRVRISPPPRINCWYCEHVRRFAATQLYLSREEKDMFQWGGVSVCVSTCHTPCPLHASSAYEPPPGGTVCLQKTWLCTLIGKSHCGPELPKTASRAGSIVGRCYHTGVSGKEG